MDRGLKGLINTKKGITDDVVAAARSKQLLQKQQQQP